MDRQTTSFHDATQFDLAPASHLGSWRAQRLRPPQRRDLAVQILAKAKTVSELARRQNVSRKFLTRQARIADEALGQAFAPTPKPDDVLFYLPVTEAWLRQLVLGLVLICRGSYRGVRELLGDLFGYAISVGTVHNILRSAVESAREINGRCDLAGVCIGAHDEIFQAGHPVLVGVDTASTYCYLLSLEDHRDAETWAVRLLELKDQGFAPDATIADAGAGLRAGQALALPEVPCRGDVFHILHEMADVVLYLENRAYGALGDLERIQRQFDRAQRCDGRGRAKSPQSAARLLRQARTASDRAVTLCEEVTLLMNWLHHDILAVAGPCLADRRALYDFVVAELKSRAARCSHRLVPICRQLQNQRDDLLAFAEALDQELELLAEEFQVPAELLRRLLMTLARKPSDSRRWTEEAAIRKQLRGRFHEVQTAVAAVASGTVRASSLAENLNSRLRSYFFLRRHLGSDYLTLLQFFLNHRRLQRSEHPQRVGKTPAEVLTGKSHPHWLELLGYTRYVRG